MFHGVIHKITLAQFFLRHGVFPETRVIGLHFCRCMYGSIFIQILFVQWAPKDTSFLHRFAFWPFKVVQGHPRSMILVPTVKKLESWGYPPVKTPWS